MDNPSLAVEQVEDPITYDDPDGIEVTVQCSSCEQRVYKTDAKRFVSGNVRTHSTSGMKREYVFHKGSVNEGWLCKFCHDEPAGFFSMETADRLPWTAIALGLAMGMIVGYLLLTSPVPL